MFSTLLVCNSEFSYCANADFCILLDGLRVLWLTFLTLVVECGLVMHGSGRHANVYSEALELWVVGLKLEKIIKALPLVS